jgi:glycosyltransferase involved in cell wall biosynthesis
MNSMADKAIYENSVTLIGSLPPIKGISPYCYELMKSLSRSIHVEFIGFEKMYPDFLYPGGKSKEEGVIPDFSKIPNVSIRNILTYYNPLSWIWAGLSIKSKVVHAQWWSHVLAPIYFVILSLCKIRGKKIIITVHNVTPHEKNNFNQYLNKIILLFGDQFIVHSLKNVEELHDIYGVNKEKIIRIPHGISRIKSSKIEKKVSREKLGLPVSKKIILCFGGIRDYKGIDIILEALPTISKKMDNVLLVIAGQPWVDWIKYEEIIQKNNLNHYVKLFLKFIPSNEMDYFYYASDLAVLPYRNFTSQSGAGSEALSYKIPLIVSDVGGLSELVKDKNCIVEQNNPEDLASKILTVLNDENLFMKLSRESGELADKYSWNNVAKETVNLYEKCLKTQNIKNKNSKETFSNVKKFRL